ncbi:ZIP family metal transporter [Chitinophaga sedimenti]|uniref:ZIP family metal transporter n=1 Tax=Chitinophaga sedimenti TaxID=2033606 RepID=UPI002003067B|nr:ZIP family metal transporter [Chitinophaga sedimenti]MCK7560095.1 ZIP family metal transporter [Chitinophaga sedimenti]
MNWIYLILILLATVAGGMIPMLVRNLRPNLPIYMLAFTGAFLFGITIMHLLPEVYHELGHEAGIYIVIGFFVRWRCSSCRTAWNTAIRTCLQQANTSIT